MPENWTRADVLMRVLFSIQIGIGNGVRRSVSSVYPITSENSVCERKSNFIFQQHQSIDGLRKVKQIWIDSRHASLYVLYNVVHMYTSDIRKMPPIDWLWEDMRHICIQIKRQNLYIGCVHCICARHTHTHTATPVAREHQFVFQNVAYKRRAVYAIEKIHGHIHFVFCVPRNAKHIIVTAMKGIKGTHLNYTSIETKRKDSSAVFNAFLLFARSLAAHSTSISSAAGACFSLWYIIRFSILFISFDEMHWTPQPIIRNRILFKFSSFQAWRAHCTFQL